jgi:peroxiredoxin
MNNLTNQIAILNVELSKQVPQEIAEGFQKSIENLKLQNIASNSLKIGDKIPDFLLPNSINKVINSKDILQRGKMIIAFYRGSWCPYCNLELRALQENLSLITAKKTTLVAISPQIPDHSLALIEKHNLQFEVLTDLQNNYAKQLGISFKLQDFVLPHYKTLGINLSDFNNDQENTLPIPAIFVVNEEGIVIYRFLDVNYMNRVNIEELIDVL